MSCLSLPNARGKRSVELISLNGSLLHPYVKLVRQDAVGLPFVFAHLSTHSLVSSSLGHPELCWETMSRVSSHMHIIISRISCVEEVIRRRVHRYMK